MGGRGVGKRPALGLGGEWGAEELRCEWGRTRDKWWKEGRLKPGPQVRGLHTWMQVRTRHCLMDALSCSRDKAGIIPGQ